MSHQGKTTLKHIKNPGVQLRMAAHDIKPGIAGYRDRIALLHADKNKLQDEYHPDEKEDKALNRAIVRKMVKKTALKNTEEGVTFKSFKEQLLEKSYSEKQARTMAAAAHNSKFAKKVGIPQSVAKDFNQADKGTAQLSRAMKDEAIDPNVKTTDTLDGRIKGGDENQHTSYKVKLKTEAMGCENTPMSRATKLAKAAYKKLKDETMMGKAGGTSEEKE